MGTMQILSDEWRDLKQILDSGGYKTVGLRPDVGIKNGGSKRLRVHILVLEAFIGLRPTGMECCHNNGIRLDNRLENLRWGTTKSNAQDTVKHDKSRRGERNAFVKLTKEQVLEIRKRMDEGQTSTRIMQEFKISRSHANAIKSRRFWAWMDDTGNIIDKQHTTGC